MFKPPIGTGIWLGDRTVAMGKRDEAPDAMNISKLKFETV